MSASREWTEWHLTEDGWVRGTQKTDGCPVKKASIPEGRVLTCVFKEHVGWASPHRECKTEWDCGNDLRIQNLKDQFGDCPNHL